MSDLTVYSLQKLKDKAIVLRDSPDILQDKRKYDDIIGIVENIDYAIRALETGKDDKGRAISASMVGTGILNLVKFMKQNASWFYLDVNASEDTRNKIEELRTELEANGTLLSLLPPGEEKKRWWQFWK